MEANEQMKQAFNYFDRNGDGTISVSELGMALRAQGKNPTEAQLKEFLEGADKDHTDSIDFEEFQKIMGKPMQDSADVEGIKKAFKVFDRDGGGTISASELRKVMTTMGEPLTEEEADIMLMEADKNQDGVIDYNEFVVMYLASSSAS